LDYEGTLMSDEEPLPTGLQLTALDPIFREHPHDYLDRLRTEEPVHWDSTLRRLFLTRFEDVEAAPSNRSLSVDPRKAPDAKRRHAAPGDPPFRPSMSQLDEPDHKRLRGLVSQAFNQRSVDAWRPRIRAIAEALLDALAGRGPFDVIAEFAAPLPIIVIAEMLGVDPGDMRQFKRWSDARSHSLNPRRSPQQAEAWAVAKRELSDYFARVVEARRSRRGSDVISILVAAEEAGDSLSTPEMPPEPPS
jgi:cytochrome P450